MFLSRLVCMDKIRQRIIQLISSRCLVPGRPELLVRGSSSTMNCLPNLAMQAKSYLALAFISNERVFSMAVSASRFPLTTVQCRQTCFSNSKIEPFVPFFKRCIRTLQTHKLLISNVMHFVLYSEVHLFCICLLLLFVLVLFFVFVFSPRDVKQYFSVSKLVVKL